MAKMSNRLFWTYETFNNFVKVAVGNNCGNAKQDLSKFAAIKINLKSSQKHKKFLKNKHCVTFLMKNINGWHRPKNHLQSNKN